MEKKELVFELGPMREEVLRKFANELAKNIDEYNLILLIGEIGTGKTTFVKALCESLGIKPEVVSSPTFTLVNVYDSPKKTVYHVDVYRLTGIDDLFYLLDDQIEGDDSLLIVEWADIFSEFFQGDRVEVHLEYLNNDLRNVSIKVVGIISEKILKFLRRWINAKKVEV